MNGQTVTVSDAKVQSARRLLKFLYGVVPVVAGVDKFFDTLVHWTIYVNPSVALTLSLHPTHIMYGVGIVEIIAGLLVLSRYTKFGAYLVAAWLLLIALNLVSMGMYYDIAVRDVVMAGGAVALAWLS